MSLGVSQGSDAPLCHCSAGYATLRLSRAVELDSTQRGPEKTQNFRSRPGGRNPECDQTVSLR